MSILVERPVYSLGGTFLLVGRGQFGELLTSSELTVEYFLEFGLDGRFDEGLKTGCLRRYYLQITKLGDPEFH